MIGDIMDIESKLTGNIKDLYEIWSKYFAISVYKNDHLKHRMFFFVLGTYLTHKGIRVVYSGRYNTTRIHLFNIQQSGSGKSEAMKAAHFLMKSIGLNGLYLTKTTDAALVGTISLDNKHNPVVRPGELSKRDYLIWDEGSILLRTGPFSENLQDIMQMTTDDPGYIEKILANGLIRFTTETSICASSYLEDNINLSLFKKGYFQRVLLSNHLVSDEDISNFIQHKSKMMEYSYGYRKDIIDSFVQKLSKIDFTNCEFTYDKQNKYIKINPNDMEKICLQTVEFVKIGQKAFVNDNQRHNIMNTFLSRNNQIISIASIIAIINGKKEIGSEELEIGLDMWKDHIRSANTLLMRRIDKTSTDDYRKRLLILRSFLIPRGGIKRTELYKSLTPTTVEGWDLGQNNTLNFIKDALERGDIQERDKLIFYQKE